MCAAWEENRATCDSRSVVLESRDCSVGFVVHVMQKQFKVRKNDIEKLFCSRQVRQIFDFCRQTHEHAQHTRV